MHHSSRKFIWLVAACAAFVAQVVPQAFCDACDRGCCTVEAADCGPTVNVDSDGAAGHLTDGCPLCAAASEECHNDAAGVTSGVPCRCQLTPSQDQPLTANQPPPHREHVTHLAILETGSLHVPHSVGRSREYAEASRAIPVRPTRILFGVWRN